MNCEQEAEAPPYWMREFDFNASFMITEEIDGTRSCVCISRLPPDVEAPEGVLSVEVDGVRWVLRPASPLRWLSIERDNFGFAAWVYTRAEQLTRLGPGWHRGEWYGQGIQRTYGLADRRWALFDAERWTKPPPGLAGEVEVVPVLARVKGPQLADATARALHRLDESGSLAVPGQRAEGILISPVGMPTVRFKARLRG
jgi:hypothetical protein